MDRTGAQRAFPDPPGNSHLDGYVSQTTPRLSQRWGDIPVALLLRRLEVLPSPFSRKPFAPVCRMRQVKTRSTSDEKTEPTSAFNTRRDIVVHSGKIFCGIGAYRIARYDPLRSLVIRKSDDSRRQKPRSIDPRTS